MYLKIGRRADEEDTRKRDAGYEELEGQMRVSGMRDTKSGKGRCE
ncbi:hypothetical protein VCRA2123O444_410012 [Vibrio crassostreae]|nr:hypothetical protein VCRA2110O182_180012 [Vibrio crassostreae]CAK1939732.1 hypothetical protein VCRA2119O432_260012 [Vibrio crassostreae]CAK1940154.1 hypothetical protein VCRA2118O429_250061 [Vibrio crassostreae]CAK1940960.1 hypothetical protein VCRA2114O423_260012 [Vibrio crassostreae]CAK1942116.1 hypothetical protein VCRA2113O411_260012 [Vibrio crassostreae]